MSKTGLREQKKAQTHQQILEAAGEVFVERGFDNVTLDEIAEHADVNRRTLLRYFPTKVHLVLWGPYEALRIFTEQAANRGDESIVDVWERHVEEGAKLLAQYERRANVKLIVGDEPAIKQAYMAIQAEYQKLIFEGLLAEYGHDTETEIEVAVMAAALVGANYLIGARYLEREAYQQILDAELKVVSTVRQGLSVKKRKK
nr:TetR/AcrR family transcriptional regulator [Hyphomonas sp. Mor2]